MISLPAEASSRLAVVCKTPTHSTHGWADRSPHGKWSFAPADGTHAINLVCVTQLDDLQYATRWASLIDIVGSARKVIQSEVPKYRLIPTQRPKCTGVARILSPFVMRERPAERVEHSTASPWHNFSLTWYPHSTLNAAAGWPPVGYMSPAIPAVQSPPEIWCQCVGIAAVISGYDGRTALTDDTEDLLLAMALRAIYPKYVREVNCSGNPVDVRDPIGLTMLSNRDCDGAAMLVCQFYNNVRALTPASIQAATDSPLISRIAVALATRARQKYGEAVLVFGRARSPSKGPKSESFGHCWAALLPSSGGRLLHVEATAPLCARRGEWPPPGFSRVFKVGSYPGPVAGIDYRGVREFEQWMYFETWMIIGAAFSVKMNSAPWSESIAYTRPPQAAYPRYLLDILKLMPIQPLDTLEGCPAAITDAARIQSLDAYRDVVGFTSAPVGGFTENTDDTIGAGKVVVVKLHRPKTPTDSGTAAP